METAAVLKAQQIYAIASWPVLSASLHWGGPWDHELGKRETVPACGPQNLDVCEGASVYVCVRVYRSREQTYFTYLYICGHYMWAFCIGSLCAYVEINKRIQLNAIYVLYVQVTKTDSLLYSYLLYDACVFL